MNFTQEEQISTRVGFDWQVPAKHLGDEIQVAEL